MTAVRLSPDYSKVEVTAKIAKSAAGLIVEDAKFWVVEPRVTLSGVSGLGTLLSGNYIGFEVGKSDKKARQFSGLDTPPIITGGQPGRQFVLKAENLGSLGIGSPIYYRRLQAGQVVAYKLADDGKAIELTVFVNGPYDRYVTPGTRFWNASGVDVSVGAGGVDVRMQSVVSLLAGGLAFETPPFVAKAEPAAPDTVFTLYSDQATAMKQPDAIATRYVLHFSESLRGLSVGAPVTLLGLPAGEVTAVGLDLEPGMLNIRGRVEIVTFPERFEYFPDAAKAKVDWSQETPVLPVIPSTLPNLEAKLGAIMAKVDALPYEAIGADVTKALGTLNVTLQGAGTMMNRIDADVTPELKATLEEVRRVVATADGVLKDGVGRTLNEVNTTLEDLRRPLATADAVLKNTDATLVGRNSPVQQELRDALQEITLAARSLRVLMDYLDQHPDSLLRGKTEDKR